MSDQAQWSVTVTPVVAAMTTLCASTALAGVIDGMRWLGYAGVAVVVVTATGLGLRAIRTPTLLVGLSQMVALLCLLVALFTNSGILGLLPGPAAIGELGDVLRNSVEAVRLGVPPVSPTPPVLCLVVIAIGLVAVLVDTLAVAAGTPAACGLVLLCVYAVPASLADELLPWWSFVLGAGSFAVLLAVDGAHRHQQWRNRPDMPGTSGQFGSPVAMVGSALVLGLVAGVVVTGVGTVGSLPGGGGGGGGGGGLALKPFTALRGMLDQGSNVELFRVRGLGNESRYLRAMTLPRYDRNGGWIAADALPDDVPADSDLPPAPGDDGGGTVTRIEIEPINSQDLWAPIYGIPRKLRDIPKGMFYDQSGGMVYSRNSRKLPTYVEEADMSQPSADDLRLTGTDFGEIDPVYLAADGIDADVAALAAQLTENQPTMFDKALALQKYFDPANGFSYQTQTGTSSDEDALKEFLFGAKVGYCEQFASAMGILARAAGIPSRVAIGYTAGYQSGDYRSITTQDAHAWVEVFFPRQGWVAFDPTPLSDGRGYEPPYIGDQSSTGPSTGVTEEELPSGSASNSQAPNADKLDNEDPAANAPIPGQADGSWSWPVWAGLGLAVLAALLALAAARTRTRWSRLAVPAAAGVGALALFFLLSAMSWWLSALLAIALAATAPVLVRVWRRRAHRHAVATPSADAASAAWAELMAESWDRGAELTESDTVRTAARRLAREHSLDDDGKQALRTVVNSVERSWYGGQSEHDPALAAAFDDVVRGLRRTAPLPWKARLLPRSVLNPRRTRRPD
ncbi:transglutaminase family protein [Actinokineospora sp.]|uniref:transglutaminase family protein n=1 Tax=Actinokineospora sp. TaxID=1872133 RepID=UPI004037DEB5